MSTTRTRRARLATGMVAAVAMLGALGGTGSAATAAPADTWVNGDWVQDTIVSCITGQPAPGYTARTSFLAEDGDVPEVGERFYMSVEVGLPGLPCTDSPAVLPEIILPAGLEYADDDKHPVRWAISRLGEKPGSFSTKDLVYDRGVNGGVLVGLKSDDYPDGGPIEVRQSESLEIQVPVRSTRTMKGPATQQPNCDERLEGTAPCPVAQSGDHLQVAIVKTDTGPMQYVIPYVGLFVQKATPSLSSKVNLSSKRKGKITVRIGATTTAGGTVVVREGRRTLGTGKVTNGTATVRLPKAKPGKHRIVVEYSGSSTVAAAQKSFTVRVR
jgi:hypothetical protein